MTQERRRDTGKTPFAATSVPHIPFVPKFTCPGPGLGNPWNILGVSPPQTHLIQFGTDEQWSEN